MSEEAPPFESPLAGKAPETAVIVATGPPEAGAGTGAAGNRPSFLPRLP